MKAVVVGVCAVLCLVGTAGCSTLLPGTKPAPVYVIKTGAKANLAAEAQVAATLREQHRQCAGVPHKTGGMSPKGVDCSGLVYITYKEKFGIVLPRSSSLQKTVGVEVAKAQLRPGDLVFFRTQLINRHVGIYMGEGEFMHVSSKRGVMISRFTDHYWKGRYVTARRVQ